MPVLQSRGPAVSGDDAQGWSAAPREPRGAEQ